jgi:multidrug efflux pump subunit AcrA (membrane-fusion protein)
VVIMREEIAPADVPQPAIFTPGAASNNSGSTVPGVGVLRKLESVEEEKSSEADAAKRHEKEARVTAAKKNADAAAAARSLHAAETNLAKAEAELKAFEPAQGAAASPAPNAVAEAAKAKAAAKLEAAQVQLQTSKLQAQAASDNAKLADEEARAAAVAMSTAMEAAEEASQNLSPVSVLVSRKTQRLYIRKGNQPVFEAPVRIRDADKPIGTFIFTALDYAGTSGSMRWNVVSMYKTPTNIEPFVQVKQTRTKLRSDELPVADVASAQAALDRLTVPEEAADRISRVVLPGSSLIVSDEGPSIETGKDTDFVLFMSGEPQGGIAIRQHNTASRRGRDEYDDAFGRSWGRRGRPGGGFPFFFSDD